MTAGYTKLFSSIVASTIWQESKETKVVWITMLAMKNRDQVVESSIPGLAKMAGVTIPECESALKVLSSPDEYSRSREFEGRRIEAVDGGWRILNGEKYRQKMGADERREYKARKQAEYRARKAKRGKPLPGESVFTRRQNEGASEKELSDIQDNAFKEQSPPYRAESNGEPV